jgi:hypothetical protein
LTRGARVAGLLAAAIVLGACGGGSSGSARTGASTTTTPTSTTAGPGGSVNIGIICSTPTDAATAVVNAWVSNNLSAARRCGTPTALVALFARPAGPGGGNPGAAGWILQRCAGVVCSFAHSHGTVQLTMSGSDAAGWVVARVQFGT